MVNVKENKDDKSRSPCLLTRTHIIVTMHILLHHSLLGVANIAHCISVGFANLTLVTLPKQRMLPSVEKSTKP